MKIIKVTVASWLLINAINTQQEEEQKNLNLNKVQNLRTQFNKIHTYHKDISDSNRLYFTSLYIAIHNGMKATVLNNVKRR